MQPGLSIGTVAQRQTRRYHSAQPGCNSARGLSDGRRQHHMPELKLIALDAEDLAVLSAHVQDAVLRVGDIAYQPAEKRFALIANRFDWAELYDKQRRRCGLRFERVLGVKRTGLDPTAINEALSLLAITYEPSEPPAGHVTLVFSGAAAIRLEVECIEAELRDLGAAWSAANVPKHPDVSRGASAVPKAGS